uniref:CUB domain-containing protein n=1 Tax=Ascaris lumbricoides TaxID=6252 RepID=A0A9J2PJW5_ASCLU
MIDRLPQSLESTFFAALLFTTIFAHTASKPVSSLDINDACKEFHAGGLVGMNEFASPGYPQKYPPSRDCVRVIEAPLGHDILIHFRHVFQIESTYEESRVREFHSNAMHCPNDFIEIRDGRYGFSPLIGRFCGMQIPQGEIRAKSGTAWLRFYSDEVLEYKGFYADYEVQYCAKLIIGWVYRLEKLTRLRPGFFYILPNYGNTSDSVDCVWRVEVPEPLHVALFVENFTLGLPNVCDANFLEIYSGHTSDSPLRRFCGISASQTFAMHSTVFVRIYASRSALNGLYARLLFTAYSRPNETIADFFATGYSRLLVIVFAMFILTVLLCLWSLTRCSRLKSHRSRCDDYVKELSSIPPSGTISRLAANNALPTCNLTADQNGECRLTLTSSCRTDLRDLRSISQPIGSISWRSDETREENISTQEGTTFASLLSRLGIQNRCTATPPHVNGSFLNGRLTATSSALDDSGVWKKRFSRSETDQADEDSTTTNWLTASDLAFPLDRRRYPSQRSLSQSPVRVHIRE